MIEIGLFCDRLTDTDFSGRPCLFLDRDGVLVDDVDYLHRLDDVSFIPDVPSAVAAVNRLGLAVVLVTNQAGIGHGYYGWEEFRQIQQAIVSHLDDFGAHFDLVLACAYHISGVGPYAKSHLWRKPGPGMFLETAQLLNVDLSSSLVVGDKASDLVAGASAGLRTGALTLTGHGREELAMHYSLADQCRANGMRSVLIVENAAQAIYDWIIDWNNDDLDT